MSTSSAKFSVGQVIRNCLFDYRGVIIDVDPYFKGSEDWYRDAARTSPPKDRPWYHVLVDGQVHRTYVAERNLEPDQSGAPINHQDMALYFEGLGEDGYILRRKGN